MCVCVCVCVCVCACVCVCMFRVYRPTVLKRLKGLSDLMFCNSFTRRHFHISPHFGLIRNSPLKYLVYILYGRSLKSKILKFYIEI